MNFNNFTNIFCQFVVFFIFLFFNKIWFIKIDFYKCIIKIFFIIFKFFILIFSFFFFNFFLKFFHHLASRIIRYPYIQVEWSLHTVDTPWIECSTFMPRQWNHRVHDQTLKTLTHQHRRDRISDCPVYLGYLISSWNESRVYTA